MPSYLISYKDPEKNNGHEDPTLDEYTYGDLRDNGKRLQSLHKGDFLFFHKTIYDKRYITAYYIVEEVHLVENALQDELIMRKYKNPHLQKDIIELQKDETIVFGDPIRSKVLEVPLELTPSLLKQLSKPANLNPNQTLLAAMSSALRAWKELDDNDIKLLLDLIEKNDSGGRLKKTVLSSEEVFQVLERDIERYIIDNPELIAKGFVIEKSQLTFQDGSRLDLLLNNPDTKERIVVEIKKGKVGRDAKQQIKRYMKLCKEELGYEYVRGIIVCAGILPYYEDEMVKAKKENIIVKTYGWKLDFE